MPKSKKVPKKKILEIIDDLSESEFTPEVASGIFFDERIGDDDFEKELRIEEKDDDLVSVKYPEPSTYFGLRKPLEVLVKKSKRKEFTQRQLEQIFSEKTEFCLTDFTPLGKKDDFFSKMNDWYYGSFGEEVFSEVGGVPSGPTTMPILHAANARLLCKIAEKGVFGNNDPIHVHKWGFGGQLDELEIFLRQVEKVNPDVLKRLRYDASDFSAKSMSTCKNGVDFYHQAVKKLMRSGKLDFSVYDITKKPRQDGIALIESSYLFDSISSPFVSKQGNDFYEVHYRAYIDVKMLEKHVTKGFGEIIARNFRDMLLSGNHKALGKVDPRMFRNIRWEEKFVKIPDIEKYPLGKHIRKLTQDHKYALMPVPKQTVDIMRNAVNSLRKGGVFHTFDVCVPSLESMEGLDWEILRYNGAIYTPLNVPLLKSALAEYDISLKAEPFFEYIGDMMGDRIVPVSNLFDWEPDENNFNTFFPLEFVRGHEYVSYIADTTDLEYGYSAKGRKNFVDRLWKEGLVYWNDKKGLKRAGSDDYIDDYMKTMEWRVWELSEQKGCQLIMERSGRDFDNEGFKYALALSGFKEDVIDHIFKNYDKINNDEYFLRLSIEKK